MIEPSEHTSGGFLPTKIIQVLIFGDDKTLDLRPQSTSAGDTAKVKIFPIGLGLYLKSLDKEEVYFHIELYPETQTAEFWLAIEWRESTARRIRLKDRLLKERQERDKYNSRLFELMDNMPPSYSEINRRHIAEMILMDTSSYGRFDKILTLLNIADIAERYALEDKEAMEGKDAKHS